MLTHLDQAVVFHWIGMQRTRDKLPAHLVADIFLNRVHNWLAPDHQAIPIIKELNILGEQLSEPVKVTLVIGVKELRIQSESQGTDIFGCLRIGIGPDSDSDQSEECLLQVHVSTSMLSYAA